MKNKWRFMIALAPLFILGIGYVLFALWNWLVPTLFNGPVISYLQALGILLLSKLLFGGFSGGRGWRHSCHCRGGNYWKEKMRSRMEGMTPEEKEKFKQTFKNRCGDWDENESTQSVH
jgi:hypothetical protein